MSSLRRSRKGPGLRPQSAKRQRIMELRARGWTVLGPWEGDLNVGRDQGSAIGTPDRAHDTEDPVAAPGPARRPRPAPRSRERMGDLLPSLLR